MRRWAPLAAAIVIGVVAPTVVAAVSGNLGIPHNDAWAYSRIARTFGETGHVELVGWNRSALVGQFAVLGPLARSVLAQQLFVALLGAVLLFCVHELTVRRIGHLRAGFVTAAVALWPGFALLTTSFMADVPMAATAFLALWIGDRAIARDSRLLFSLAMLAGLWSCTIRLQGVAAPAAVALVALAHARVPGRRLRWWWVVGAAAVALVAFALFTRWQNGLPNGDHASLVLRGDPISVLVEKSVRAFFELAIVGGPVALAFARPWRWRWAGWGTAAATLLVGALAVHQFGAEDFFLPNYLGPAGAYADVLPPAGVVFGGVRWDAVVVFSIVMGAVLAGALAEHAPGSRRRTGTGTSALGVFAILTIVGTLLTFTVTPYVYGRYFIPVAPWILAVVAAPPTAVVRAPASSAGAPAGTSPTGPRAAVPAGFGLARVVRNAFRGAGVVALLLSFVLSSAIALNAWSFDRARWTWAEGEVRDGIPADRIDAGIEWLGWWSPDGVTDRSHTVGWGFQGMFSRTPSCVALSAVPPERIGELPAGWEFDRAVSYRTYLVVGDTALFAYRTGAPDCG